LLLSSNVAQTDGAHRADTTRPRRCGRIPARPERPQCPGAADDVRRLRCLCRRESGCVGRPFRRPDTVRGIRPGDPSPARLLLQALPGRLRPARSCIHRPPPLADRGPHRGVAAIRQHRGILDSSGGTCIRRAGRDGATRRDRMNEPSISIVTPTLNDANSLWGCLDSVCSQAYRSVEHFVVDGGSGDATITLAEAAPGVSTVTLRGSNQARAINEGLRRSSGEILAWLNADDRYAP